ncbi:hypothetical protein A11A3_10436 [Alcanivorax hongdengensis A-11-3]|uniref:DUF349 domain-containing protein n=1 Tax=Alcanivorax hongdengensis A-11-3 TaxID=1177179 RepID=L0WAP1_9GAMM|nr:DUF349 domain-containing protein [Alcanivorax hongdengensis]EKF74069.1 hypothetical protein A11A3_10436 [Alcanivorax hongdengensis A-11-3]
MLGRFLKPRWQHTDAGVRLKAVESMVAANDAALLAQLARGDASELVRAAATGRLTDFALLDEVHQRDEAPSVRQAASLRIMALLAGTVADAPPLDTRIRLIRLTGNDEALAQIASHSPDAACRDAAVSQLKDQDQLFHLAIHGAEETLRVNAAQRLASLPLLKRLAREGRDKRVVRLARDQAKALQQQQQEEQAHTARVIHLADTLEQHARRRTDALYGARLEQLEQQWQQYQRHATPELAERVQQALRQCQHQLEQQQYEAEQQALAATAIAEREAASQGLYQLLNNATAQTWEQQLGELRAALATQQRRWQSADQQAPAADNERQAFENLTRAFQTMIDLASRAMEQYEDPQALAELAAQWPREYPRPAVLQPPQAEPVPAEPASRTQPREHNPHRGLIVALKRELRQGNLRHANRLWHKAEALVEEGSAPALARELDKLQARRRELQDWHAFAAEPKKVELCEQMEALRDSAMDAPQLASAIQALHDEWRELMSSDQDQDQALWERFKAASDIAYQPCREHFSAQDQVKADNLKKRRTLCEQLASFLAQQDWEKVDWQALWQIRQQAPRDWKALQPVRFTDNRDVKKQFSALLAQMDEKLDAAIDEASQTRQAVIEQAVALEQLDDAREAARQAQQLQQQWRQTPWLPPARHRSLQKQFRKVMDRIFSARDRQFEEHRQQQQARQDHIQQALDQLEALLDAPGDTRDAGALEAARQAVQEQARGDMPKPQFRRYQALQRRYEEHLNQQQQRRRGEKLHEQLAALPRADQANDSGYQLAVALEVLAGLPSPEAEQSRRMAWQLEQLPAAMKRQSAAPMEEAAAVIAASADACLCEATFQRTRRALEALVRQ